MMRRPSMPASASRIRAAIASFAASSLLAGCITAESPPSAPAPHAAFDKSLIARGEALSAIGNCRGCHTTPDGRAFAGGVPLSTPFGTVYSTNITPDVETGIGAWSEADFHRAMREGVDRAGRHLYPVFPYDHFTHVTDEDDRAIYAYLMTRPAVRARAHANELMFPFSVRATIGVWKALYFKPGPRPFASRGEYLVDGLGHCGGCHTPRNAAGAERREHALDGGEAEGWHAYAINGGSQSPVPWTVDAMTAYLRRGFHEEHGISRGPMALVTDELADAPESELREMSSYIVGLMARAPKAVPDAPRSAAGGNGGAAIYAAACASCHDDSQPLPFGGMALPRSMGVAGESPLNLMNVILYGLPPAAGATAPIMPGFDGALGDAQIVELAAWMRARFTRKGPWPDLEGALRKARRHGAEGSRYAAGGNGLDPAAVREKR
jgi:mono/diheme cytochrome c family protein